MGNWDSRRYKPWELAPTHPRYRPAPTMQELYRGTKQQDAAVDRELDRQLTDEDVAGARAALRAFLSPQPRTQSAEVDEDGVWCRKTVRE